MNRLVIIWNVSEECNGSCLFCHYGTRSVRPDRTKNKHNTTEDQAVRFGKVLGDYSRAKKRQVLVSWLSGEPFLWKPIYTLSPLFFDQYGLQISATTNGLALQSRKVRQLILDYFEEITISLDGPEAFHDWCRNSPGAFRKIKQNILLLKQEKNRQNKNLRIKVNSILMRGNIEHFADFCIALCDWGVDAVSFNQLGGISRPEFYPENRLLPEQVTLFAQEFPGLKERLLKKNLLLYGNDQYLEWIRRTANNEAAAVQDCSPGRAALTISASGIVAPCSATTNHYGIHYRELNHWRDLDKLETRYQEALLTNRAAACDRCLSTQYFGKFMAD